MTDPFFSKAIFSWNVPGVDGGEPNKFADRLKAAGFEAVYLKMANGTAVFKPSTFTYPLWGENVKQELVDALRARGIKVIGWQFNYGDNIAGEAAVAIAQTKRFNLDGWIFDVESKFEANANAVANAYALTSAYRAACPDTPLAFCSWAQWKSPDGVTWHNGNMASAFMERCDVGMPMMYWGGTAASGALWLLNESVRLWQNITNKPIIPTGRAYSGDGGYVDGAAITAFADAAKAKGLKGISWWSLDAAAKNATAWAALTATPGLAPVVVTPEPPPPAVDPHLAQLEAAYNELLDIQAGITAAKDAFAADLVAATNKFADELVRQNGEIEYVKSILKGS